MTTNLDKIVCQTSPDPEIWGQDIARQNAERKHGSVAERQAVTQADTDAEKFNETAVRANDCIQLLACMFQVFHPPTSTTVRHVC